RSNRLVTGAHGARRRSNRLVTGGATRPTVSRLAESRLWMRTRPESRATSGASPFEPFVDGGQLSRPAGASAIARRNGLLSVSSTHPRDDGGCERNPRSDRPDVGRTGTRVAVLVQPH